MKKRQMTAILFAVMLGLMQIGCGGNEDAARDAMTESAQENDQQPAADDAAAENDQVGAQEEEPAGDEAQSADVGESEALILSRYLYHINMCHLGGYELAYEKVQDGDSIYYMTYGLEGLGDGFDGGCLYYALKDLDDDGSKELLTFLLEKAQKGFSISTAVYEAKNGEVVEAAKKTMLGSALGQNVDSGDIRFMLKDGKYICMDSRQNTFVCADGSDITMSAYYYDGEHLIETAALSFVGSDWGGTGAESTELLDQLYTMKFDKTAAAVCDRDLFRFCDADEGTEVLFKIRLDNSWSWRGGEEVDMSQAPQACLFQYSNLAYGQGYVLPESNSRMLSMDEIKYMSKENLRIARNEIYARYGWRFEDRELQDYFDKKVWYAEGENVDDSVLSDIERANKDLIVEAEKAAQKTDSLAEYLGNPQGAEELDARELGMISGFLSGMDAYGFALSYYDDVRDVNLYEVLYNGGGIDGIAFTEDMEKEYLKMTGQEEFFTDHFALAEADIDAFLQEKTGYGLDQMNRPLGWIYLPQQKAYALEVGDTNYLAPSVYDGVKTPDGTYYIEYGYETPFYGFDGESCILVLKKSGDSYQFVSNRPKR